MKHTACTHPATPAGRAACRKGNATPAADTVAEATKAVRSPKVSVDLTQVKSVGFETETCMRCGGSGTYPSACWNGVCLGCSGSGVRFTRRGLAAYKKYWAYVEANNTVNVTELEAGDMFLGDHRKWVRILRVERGDYGTSTCTVGVKGSGTEVVTTTHYTVQLITRMKDGREMARTSGEDATYVKRPSGEAFRAGVAQVAHLSGTILTMKDADN